MARYGQDQMGALLSGGKMVGGMEQAQTTVLANQITREGLRDSKDLDTLTQNRSVLLEAGLIRFSDDGKNVNLVDNWEERLNAIDDGSRENVANALGLPDVMGDYFSTAADGNAVRKKNIKTFTPSISNNLVPTALKNKIAAAKDQETIDALNVTAAQYENGEKKSYVTPIINAEQQPFFATIFGTDADDDEVIVLSREDVGTYLRARATKLNSDFARLNPEANTSQEIASNSPLFDKVGVLGTPSADLDPSGQGGMGGSTPGEFDEIEAVDAVFDKDVGRPTTLSILDQLKGYYKDNPIVYSPGYSEEDRALAEAERTKEIGNIKSTVANATPGVTGTNDIQLYSATNLDTMGNTTFQRFAKGKEDKLFVTGLVDLPAGFNRTEDGFGQYKLGAGAKNTQTQGYAVYEMGDDGQPVFTGKYLLGGKDGKFGSGTQARFRESLDNAVSSGTPISSKVKASDAEISQRTLTRNEAIKSEVDSQVSQLEPLPAVTDPIFKTFDEAFPGLQGLTGDALDAKLQEMVESEGFGGFKPEQVNAITDYLQKENIENIDDFVAKEKENNAPPEDSYKKLYMMNMLLADRNLKMPGGTGVKEVTDSQFNNYFYGTGYDAKSFDAAKVSVFDSNTTRMNAVTNRMNTNLDITKMYNEARSAANAADTAIYDKAVTAFGDNLNELELVFKEFSNDLEGYFDESVEIKDKSLPTRFRAKLMGGVKDFTNSALESNQGQDMYKRAKKAWESKTDLKFTDEVFTYYYAQPAGYSDVKEYGKSMMFQKVAMSLENREGPFGGIIADGVGEWWDDIWRSDRSAAANLNSLENTLRVVVDSKGKPLKIVGSSARGAELEDSAFTVDFLDMNFLTPGEMFLLYDTLDRINEDGSAYISDDDIKQE